MLKAGEILVAEDSRLLLELLRDALLAHGLTRQVVACGDGKKLLAAARERLERGEAPALYLLDIVMPGPSGLAVAHELRALEAFYKEGTTPILLYSSLPRSAEIESVIETCWPARFCQKEEGARADQLALAVVELLQGRHAG